MMKKRIKNHAYIFYISLFIHIAMIAMQESAPRKMVDSVHPLICIIFMQHGDMLNQLTFLTEKERRIPFSEFVFRHYNNSPLSKYYKYWKCVKSLYSKTMLDASCIPGACFTFAPLEKVIFEKNCAERLIPYATQLLNAENEKLEKKHNLHIWDFLVYYIGSFNSYHLDLSSSNLYKKQIPINFFSTFHYVTTLDIHDNKLSTLPGLQELTFLKVLDMSYNLFPIIPEHLSSLEVLFANNNRIKALPSMRFLTCLRELDLSRNSIINGTEIGEAINLRKLKISNNHFTTIDFVSRLCCLQILKARCNDITSAAVLAKSSLQVTFVDLKKNKIHDISFLKNSRINYVNLSYNQIRVLPHTLPPHNNYVLLNLNYNKISFVPVAFFQGHGNITLRNQLITNLFSAIELNRFNQ